MSDAKSGNLNLHFVQNNKAGGVCLQVGWKCPDGNWFVLNKLKRGEPCGCPALSHGSETTALAYSVFQYINNKLAGDAKSQEASKVSGVSCGLQNGEFFICVKPAGSMSGIRKALMVVEQNLAPEKMYPLYAANIKLLNGTSHREEFNECANAMRESMKSQVCLLTGKVKLDSAKLKAIVEKAAGKYSTGTKVGPIKKPASLVLANHGSDFPTVKAKGMNAALVSDFIDYATHERTAINSGDVLVYRENWTKPKGLNAKKVDTWCNARFGKLSDATSALVYLSCMKCEIDPSSAIAFSKTKATASSIAMAIKDALK